MSKAAGQPFGLLARLSAAEYYLLPIDECYKLVGLIRMHWKGLSGGTDVWRELGEFFSSLKADRPRWDRKRDPRFPRNLMPDLNFHVDGVEVVANAATPLLAFKLRLSASDPDQTIHTVALRCQIQLEVTHRKYSAEDQKRLLDLFGEPSRWGQTLRSLLWTHANLVVPSFEGSTQVDLPVPCSFDFNVAATKYFDGLADGEVPVCLQFSGTVFYAGPEGNLQVAPISWDKEARFKLPVRIWREMMETYYPNSAWLCLHKDVFDQLYQYKVKHGIPTWEEVMERIFPCRWKRR